MYSIFKKNDVETIIIANCNEEIWASKITDFLNTVKSGNESYYFENEVSFINSKNSEDTRSMDEKLYFKTINKETFMYDFYETNPIECDYIEKLSNFKTPFILDSILKIAYESNHSPEKFLEKTKKYFARDSLVLDFKQLDSLNAFFEHFETHMDVYSKIYKKKMDKNSKDKSQGLIRIVLEKFLDFMKIK